MKWLNGPSSFRLEPKQGREVYNCLGRGEFVAREWPTELWLPKDLAVTCVVSNHFLSGQQMISLGYCIKNGDRQQRVKWVITSLQEAFGKVVVVYRWKKVYYLWINLSIFAFGSLAFVVLKWVLSPDVQEANPHRIKVFNLFSSAQQGVLAGKFTKPIHQLWKLLIIYTFW